MLDALGFEMVDRITREALERHPAWAHFQGADDRRLILEWGVDARRLDAELRRLEHCGTQPMYPVLRLAAGPTAVGLVLAARFEPACGGNWPGYTLEPHAFGIYVRSDEFTFNRSLSGAAARTAEKLAAALDAAPDGVFPLRCTPASGPAATLDAFW